NTCFVGYTKEYGLSKASFLPLAGISAYAALDAGKVLAADVFSTDPPLAKPSKYTVLSDPKHVTGFQNVAPIVKTSVVTSLGSKAANARTSRVCRRRRCFAHRSSSLRPSTRSAR